MSQAHLQIGGLQDLASKVKKKNQRFKSYGLDSIFYSHWSAYFTGGACHFSLSLSH